jgi:hypothetical protein
MRNIFFLACLSISPVVLLAQLPAGSIASYPFDNSAADISGNGYNGTLVSTSNAANRFSTANSATAFTAGTSSGTLPGTLATALSNDFTIGYWFLTTMTAPTSSQWYGGTSLIDAEVCGQTNDWGTALIDGGKVCMGIGNPDLTIKSTLSTYNNGAWHFVTATRNHTTGVIILYIDGAQVATTSGTNTGVLSAPSLIGLGRNPCVASGVYTGTLDDLIAYNRVLTATEVTNLYNYYNTTPLPLHWVSFTGQVEGGLVQLKWKTENSVNNDHFEIERSTGNSDFSVIGVLSDKDGIDIAAGSSLYNFIDISPSKGNDFYRIKQVDKDGKYSWSSILSFSPGNASARIHLKTNPVANELILVNNDRIFIQRIQIMDISGRVLIDQAPYSSNPLLQINTSPIPPGYYLLRVNATDTNTTIGFVKL